MRLGVLLESEEGLDWSHWLNTCQVAERLGFESVWISDHLASPWSDARHGIEPWLALGVAASQTRSVRLGPLVSPITFRQPALVARMAKTSDDLAPGRFVLGLGLGWNAAEHARFGIPFPPLVERVRMLGEGIERIRQVLGERHIPVLLGGAGPKSTLPLVARYADEWNMTTSSADLVHSRTAALAEECRAIGRSAGEIRRSIAAGLLIGRDAAELRERCRRMQTLVAPLAGVELDDVPAAARDMSWLVGTPPQIVDTLRALGQAGVELAIVGHYDPGDDAALELLAAEVMPELA